VKIGKVVIVFLFVWKAGHLGLLSAQPSDIERSKDGLFISMLNNQSLNYSYLLNELVINSEQKTDVENAVSEFQTDFFKLVNDRAGPEGAERFRKLQRDFVGKIESVLLPHQLDAIKSIFFQRYYLMQGSKEFFELPSQFSGYLELSENEEKELLSAQSEARDELNSVVSESRSAAWQKISDALPEELRSIVKEYREENKVAFRLNTNSIENLQMIRDWKESDFDQFEETSFYETIFRLHGDPVLAQMLSITNEQQDHIKQLAVEFAEEDTALRQRTEADNFERVRLISQGENEKAEEIRQKNLKEKHDLLYSGAKRIADRVLLPHQKDGCNNVAKWKRYMLESRFGDEFGIPVALGKVAKLSDDQQAKIQKVVEESRDKFYKVVKQKRSSSNETILKTLTVEQRKILVEILGEPYDYKSEVIAFWDDVRSKGTASNNSK